MDGMDWFLIAIAVLLHFLILYRLGIGGLLVAYVVAALIYFLAAGTGFWAFIATATTVIAVISVTAFVPGILLVVVAVAALFLGKGASKL